MRQAGAAHALRAKGDRPVGVIVAGGAARRLGGGDKTLLRLRGRPILAWLIERIAPQCAALALNANGETGRFAPFGLPVLPDHPDDQGSGPLAGLLAGLDWTAHCHPETALMLTVPADCPRLPTDLGLRLLAGLVGGVRVAAARSGGRAHPLAALWPVEARHALRRALRQEGERRVAAFADRLGVAWVEWAATPDDPFANINTPEDLAAARLWAEAPP